MSVMRTIKTKYRDHLERFLPALRWIVPGIVFLILIWISFAHDTKKKLHLIPFLRYYPEPREWIEHDGNPVLPDAAHSGQIGTVFDRGLMWENMTVTGVPADLYYRNSSNPPVETAMTWRMWNSWRPRKAIGYSTSVDGKLWDQNMQTSIWNNDSSWDADINWPYVKKIATGKYGMWYTGQDIPHGLGGWIGYAESEDGISFDRWGEQPVMVPAFPWGAKHDEPDAIAVAHSYDAGITWVKHGNPIFLPDKTCGEVETWWDSHKVTSPHVIHLEDDYYYMFYAGFRNVDYSSIWLARSKDGLTNWEQKDSQKHYPILVPRHKSAE